MVAFPHFDYELDYGKKGYTVIGIDEVGKGCIAGPITVGAVCFPPTLTHAERQIILSLGIQDSKKLSAHKREQLVESINKYALFSITASSNVEVINKHGINQALYAAIAEAVTECIKDYPDNKISLLIDGRAISHLPYINDIERTHIIKGDSISISIAAASIIAKVSRDGYMKSLSGHEQYCWDQNKGYGTKAHVEAIRTHGLSPQHRALFVRNIVSQLNNY